MSPNRLGALLIIAVLSVCAIEEASACGGRARAVGRAAGRVVVKAGRVAVRVVTAPVRFFRR